MEYAFLYMWTGLYKVSFLTIRIIYLYFTIGTQMWLDPYILFLLGFILSLLFFLPFFSKWLSTVMNLCNSLFTGCQQAEVHSIFFKYPCFQQKLILMFHLRTNNLKEIAVMSSI